MSYQGNVGVFQVQSPGHLDLVYKPVTLESAWPSPHLSPVPSYLDELSTGSGQQMQGAGKLPKELLSRCPEASAPGPLQELLQAGTHLDTPGPMEATQRGPWRGKNG